jgi:hypothetical protein
MPCANLEAKAALHCSVHSEQDAFCLFLRSHLCICEKARGHHSPGIRSLNRLFVERILAVAARFDNHEPQDRRAWTEAFAFYRRCGNTDPLGCLVRMAAAHIFADLPALLGEVDGVEKREYDEMLDVVLNCLDSCHCFEKPGDTISDRLIAYCKKRFDPTGRRTIHLMRELAWIGGIAVKKIREAEKP